MSNIFHGLNLLDIYQLHILIINNFLRVMQKIAVIGSGLNGLAVAFGLACRGISVSIFEERAFGGNFLKDSRTSFISYRSLEFFKHFSDDIIKASGIMEYIYSFKNEYEPVVELKSDSIGYVVDNSLLKSLTVNFLKKHPLVDIRENTPIIKVINTNEGVELNSEKFAIAICASGANSSLHEMLGIKQKIFDYEQTAFVFDITHSNTHKNVATEIFDTTGVIALLPKKDEYTSSVILSIKNSYTNELHNGDILDFLRPKTQRVRHIGHIANTTSMHRYPLKTQYMLKQKHGSIFFAGDAFHAAHPVLGQSFNMSLKDVAKLCDALMEAKNLGISYNETIRNLPLKNVLNHIKIGLGTHTFASAFISENRVINVLSNAAVKIGSIVPSRITTPFLQKML